MAEPRVSVVVPNWNGLRFLPDLMAALAAQSFRDFETVIVDNGSSDGSREWLAARDDLRLLSLRRNHGFAGGMNRGIEIARAPLLLMLNNDMAPEPGFLAQLVAAADACADAGSFACLVLMRERPGVIDSAGDEIAASGRSSGSARGESDRRDRQWPEWVFGATGGAALWRREAFEQAGGFDESFFLYVEDTDLSLRAQLLGWRCRLVADAVTRHVGSGSMRGREDLRSRYCLRNHLFLLLKTYPAALLLRNIRAVVAGIAREIRFAFAATRARRGMLAALLRVAGALLEGAALAPLMLWRRARVQRSVPLKVIQDLFR